jgi:hypothetical protein
VKATDPCIA